ncbi:hypothetical protein AB6A40_004510 [Gnathostoma spinigerum]|uniref:G-protein coupled receptors family 1 profile domain-containing protein n=1 Tax=Gnathostoma spinigerum TaxID=75299 RepID=A0ABD6EK52_9BILA
MSNPDTDEWPNPNHSTTITDGNFIPFCSIENHTDNYRIFRKLVNGMLTILCVVIGTIGNLYSIKAIHMSNFYKNRSVVMAISLLTLAFWDTILLWCAFFYYGIWSTMEQSPTAILVLITPWFHGFSQIANTASVWCVATITIQRYLAGRDPFLCSRGSRLLLKASRAKRRSSSLPDIYCAAYRQHFRLPIFLSLAAILLNIPAFFEVQSRLCRGLDGRFSRELQISELRLNPHYRLWYKVVFRMLITSFAPNIIILLVTLLTIALMRGSNRSRKQLFRLSKKQLDSFSCKELMLTTISLMLVTKYLVSRSPSFCLDIFELAVGFSRKWWLERLIYAIDLSNFLIILNSSTNCLIFLKGTSWLQSRFNRHQRKRKIGTTFSSSETGSSVSRQLLRATKIADEEAIHVEIDDIKRLQHFVSTHPKLVQKLSLVSMYKTNIYNGKETVSLSNGIIAADGIKKDASELPSIFIDLLRYLHERNNDQLSPGRVPELRILQGFQLCDSVLHGEFPPRHRKFGAPSPTIFKDHCFASETERLELNDAWGCFLQMLSRDHKQCIIIGGEYKYRSIWRQPSYLDK